MAETAPSINLLPQKGESFLTQFLNWTLSIGRLLIILTEIVALSTFLYRFTLDMQIVDLNDKIKAETFIVENFEKSETTFRDLQDRLALIKKYDSVGHTTTNIFSDITQLGRGTITFRAFTVSPENAKIEAQAVSASALSQFIAKLRTLPAVSSVTLDKVENSTSTSLITVSITAALKPAAFAQPEEVSVNGPGRAVPALDTNQ